MKKNNLFLAWLLTAVIAMLEFSSCSNELAPEKPVREGMVDVVMTTSLPEVLRTYGSNSADGGLKNLEGHQPDLYVRYIMEIYNEPDTEEGADNTEKKLVKRKMLYKPLTSTGDYREAEFTARLFASKYTFVFWADIVRKVSVITDEQRKAGLYTPYYANAYFFSNDGTNTDFLLRPVDAESFVKGDLQTIRAAELPEDIAPVSPEMYDGYSCVKTVDLRTADWDKEDFTLKRPFAKLRILTNAAGTTQRVPDYEKTVTILKSGLTIPTVFNAKDHTYSKGGDENDRGYWAVVEQPIGSYNNESGNQQTLGIFYLPASGSPGSYNLEFYFDLYEKNNGGIIAEDVYVEVLNVPLQENRLTTIMGSFLADNHTITIGIEDEFEGEQFEVDPANPPTGK